MTQGVPNKNRILSRARNHQERKNRLVEGHGRVDLAFSVAVKLFVCG